MAVGSNVELPSDLVDEILLKLPVKSIIRFKCVAKSWYHLFKNPTFVSQHLSHSKKKRGKGLNVIAYEDRPVEKIGMLWFADERTLVSYHDLSPQLPCHLVDTDNNIIGVGDGLVCVFNYSNWMITLWNPATKEYRILPDLTQYIPYDGNCFEPFFQGGMDPQSNDYKLLFIAWYNYRFRSQDLLKTRYAVYRMSTDSWRVLNNEEVEMLKNICLIDERNSNPCINGVCYWLVDLLDMKDSTTLLTFDLSTEVFQFLGCVPPRIDGQLFGLHDGRIAVWETLGYFDYSIDRMVTESCSIWILNDEENWTKQIKIDPLPDPEMCQIYGFWTHGKAFVEFDDGRNLLIYDLMTREFSEPGFQTPYVWVYPYVESLVGVRRD